MPQVGSVWGAHTWGEHCWGANTWGDASEAPAPPAVATDAGDRVLLLPPPARERLQPQLRPALPEPIDGYLDLELGAFEFHAAGIVEAAPIPVIEGRLTLELAPAGQVLEARGRCEDNEALILEYLLGVQTSARRPGNS